MTDKNIILIALTNYGYKDYTLNCIKSLQNININIIDNVCVYTIGKDAYDYFTDRNIKCSLIDDEVNTNFQEYRKGNWSNIVAYKFNIIYENLLKYDFVCYFDGDIYFESDEFYHYCKNNIGYLDMLIQNDRFDDNDHTILCSGFMFIGSNDKTKNLFNPINVVEHSNKIGWGDQKYINQIKHKLKYQLLPLDLFPNGGYYYYYLDSRQLKPYMIHFNFVIGNKKKDTMIKYNKWINNETQLKTIIKSVLDTIISTIAEKKIKQKKSNNLILKKKH